MQESPKQQKRALTGIGLLIERPVFGSVWHSEQTEGPRPWPDSFAGISSFRTDFDEVSAALSEAVIPFLFENLGGVIL
jgi:hypothetical protein